jgi:hypothetical protein
MAQMWQGLHTCAALDQHWTESLDALAAAPT